MINKTGGPAHDATREKVKTAVRKMSNEKAYGPSEMSAELLKALGEYGIEWLHYVMKDVWSRNIPDGWRKSDIWYQYANKQTSNRVWKFSRIKADGTILCQLRYWREWRIKG